MANLARVEWYSSLLDLHPAFEWAASKGIDIPRIEFAQHYGVPTGLIDVTESLEVALFFATHEFLDGVARPCTDGTGILYRIDWASEAPEVQTRFHPIAIQPFPRPFRQWAWSCELMLGESFEACPGMIAVEFAQDEMFANEVRRLAEKEGHLFPADPMADVAKSIVRATTLPKAVVDRVARDITLDPAGIQGMAEDLLSELEALGIHVADHVPPALDEAQLAKLRQSWELGKASWEATFAEGFEPIIVRTQKGAAQQSDGAVGA